jgi:Cu2+-exporting ATPase
MSAADPVVSFPARGVIRLQSRSLFADPAGPDCRRFVERVLRVPEITGVAIRGGYSPRAELRFCPRAARLDQVVERIVSLLHQVPEGTETSEEGRSADVGPARGREGDLRSSRNGLATGWETRRDRPGRLRWKNRAIRGESGLCRALERETRNVLGIDRCRASALTGSVRVEYDPTQLDETQVLEILDAALAGAGRSGRRDAPDLHLPICTASLPIAAAAEFAAPALLPVAAAVLAYTSIPSFRQAHRVLSRERRLGVDVLDSMVALGCLGTMSIIPGAVLRWCLSLGRELARRTEGRSRELLLDGFDRRPGYARLGRDGSEARVPVECLCQGDVVSLRPGEVVPVDGRVVGGMGLIDPHALTGESTPAEKGVGDRVFAATLVLAGEVSVSVEAAGRATASAGIGRILDDASRSKLSAQRDGERLADRAVVPTLALGAVGMAVLGPGGALAVLNSRFDAGLRTSAPLAMLSALALCAHRGILVKDGRALERMGEVDTVLFDRSGLLNRERPEVGRILASDGFTAEGILRLAAAAEGPFHHPIALAIREEARDPGLSLPAADDVGYKIGDGIIARVEGHTVRVGSRRFLEAVGIKPTPEVRDAMESAAREGHTMVLVGIDDRLGGGIELRAAVRPEVHELVQGLRRRGIAQIAILSGDHDVQTRSLADSLGMDRHFADVLPADRADCVARLREEGRKVCFVGNAPAIAEADISISLRGASSIATDPAPIVFLEGELTRLCDLRDIARDLHRNVMRSRWMIAAPSLACLAGVFTMGFGIMASVAASSIAALAALGNGMLPLRKVAQLEAERRHRLELSRAFAAERALFEPIGETTAGAMGPAPSLDPIAADLHWHGEEPRSTISGGNLSSGAHSSRRDQSIEPDLPPAVPASTTPEGREQTGRSTDSMASVSSL